MQFHGGGGSAAAAAAAGDGGSGCGSTSSSSYCYCVTVIVLVKYYCHEEQMEGDKKISHKAYFYTIHGIGGE